MTSDVRELIQRLEKLARAATPGLWIADEFAMEDNAAVRVATYNGTPHYYHDCAQICECAVNFTGDAEVDDLRPNEPKVGVVQAERNAAFIAACSPGVILQLIAALRARINMEEGK